MALLSTHRTLSSPLRNFGRTCGPPEIIYRLDGRLLDTLRSAEEPHPWGWFFFTFLYDSPTYNWLLLVVSFAFLVISKPFSTIKARSKTSRNFWRSAIRWINRFSNRLIPLSCRRKDSAWGNITFDCHFPVLTKIANCFFNSRTSPKEEEYKLLRLDHFGCRRMHLWRRKLQQLKQAHVKQPMLSQPHS